MALVNLDPREPVVLRRGDRIAQLVVQRVEHAVFHEVQQLPGSDRGEGGFGSTGVATATVCAPPPARRKPLDRGEHSVPSSQGRSAPSDRVRRRSTTPPDDESRELTRLADPARAPTRPDRAVRRDRPTTGRVIRLDLGGLGVPALEGMELRLDMDQASGRSGRDSRRRRVGGAARAFAAPPRGDLGGGPRRDRRRRQQLRRHRGHRRRHVRRRAAGTGCPPIRPRAASPWCRSGSSASTVRAGSCAACSPARPRRDAAAAAPLEDVVRSCVVVRGCDPMAPRDRLRCSCPSRCPRRTPRTRRRTAAGCCPAASRPRDHRGPLRLARRGSRRGTAYPGDMGVIRARARPRAARRRRRLTSSQSELDAVELEDAALGSGAGRISECDCGVPATVVGRLRAVTVRPGDQTPAVEAAALRRHGRADAGVPRAAPDPRDHAGTRCGIRASGGRATVSAP